MLSGLTRALLGRLLANRQSQERKIGAFEGVPAMGLDGLGSSAYGPEAALTILIPLGAAGLGAIDLVMVPIVALLAILYLSYRQTIRAYPSSGGAYIVAQANLGRDASLLAAAALMIDYVLNVAVGISAGVGALVSAVPALHAWTLELCLALVLLTTVVNLRGTLDAGRLWALPTYLFVASFGALIAIGVGKALIAGGAPVPVEPPRPLPEATEALSLWLLLRAFASGCTAMTGVEAVSNGMSAFREPALKYARRTLTAIVAILGMLLAGIAYLAATYEIGAMDQAEPGYQSVLSQLAAAVVGRGWFYYVALGSLFCVLCLSANTSFVDFPRLCRRVAEDGFLPKPFAVVGRRLVFSVGILYLAVTAGILLLVFGGITDHLIPLFAVGAFLTFTLSQTGMVVHWWRALRQPQDDGDGRHRLMLRLAINAAGATTTGVALAVIIAAKFLEGAWITILVIPLVILLLRAIRAYYDRITGQLGHASPIDLGRRDPPIILVATEDWNRLSQKSLEFALTLSRDVVAVHLLALQGPEDDPASRALKERWVTDVEEPARRAGRPAPRLMQLEAPFRRIHVPMLKLVERIEAEFPGRLVVVMVPQLVRGRWWQALLHTGRAERLRRALLRFGGPRLAVVNVPWNLDDPPVAEALEPEETPRRPAGRPPA